MATFVIVKPTRHAALPSGWQPYQWITNLLIGVGVFGGHVVLAAEWPQFRGANHDGISVDPIITNWPAEGLRQLWKKPVSDGFSSFAVSQGRAFTLVRRTIGGTSQEVCIALNVDSGDELWAVPLGQARYDAGGNEGTPDNQGGDGPRSTPSVDNGLVYVSSGLLTLHCLEAGTGNVVWQQDLKQVYGGRNISWQNAASPLIDGDLLFVNCNSTSSSLLALRKSDGSLVWRGQMDKMTHATPVAATILGERQVVFLTQSGLVSVTPLTGEVRWRYAFPYSTATCASPVVAGDMVYCSAGYGVGAGAVRISRSDGQFTATQIWRKPNQLMNQWSTPVYCQGYLYGLYGSGQYGSAPLKCVELATGAEQWSISGFGPGGVLLVDGRLLVLSDEGELVLVQPDPNGYQEMARFQGLAGKCWNSPAVSNGRLYARSTTEAVCYDVAAPTTSPLVLRALLCTPEGLFRASFGAADGNEVAPARLNQIEIFTTSDLGLPVSQWTKWVNSVVITNGLLQLEDHESLTLRRRFFLINE